MALVRVNSSKILGRVMPSPPTEECRRENWDLLYAGYLADQRSLISDNGIYGVQVVAPLKITDQGIVYDYSDPMHAKYAGNIILGGATPANVDPAVAGAAGSDALPSHQDHRHAHAVLPGPALANSQILHQVDSLGWNEGTRTLTLQYDKYKAEWGVAGHGRVVADDQDQTLTAVLTGITGPTGATGPQGPTGATGPTGTTGTDELVKVSANDTTAEYLILQIPDYAGDSTYIAYDTVEVNDGGNEDLGLRITKTDIQAAVGVSTTWVKIHYKTEVGCTVEERSEISAADWRARHLMWWGMEDDSGDPANLSTNACDGHGALWAFGTDASHNEFGAVEHPGGVFQMEVGVADGHLDVVVTNPGQLAVEGVYALKIIHWGDVSVTGTFTDMGDGH